MLVPGYVQAINTGGSWPTGAGTVLNTATTATISPQAPGPKDFPVPTNLLLAQTVLHVVALGYLTTTATSTTATLFLAAGTTPTTLVTPNGITTGTTVLTGIQWKWESWSRITQVASTGNTISTQGTLTLFNAGAALPANPAPLTATAGLVLPCPNASGETAAAVDTTVAMPIMLRGTLAGANATIQCTQFFVEHMS